MSILAEICEHKLEEIKKRKKHLSLDKLDSLIKKNYARHCFKSNLLDYSKNHSPAIIAEIKKSSPSAGLIRPDFDAKEIAKSYEKNGAACLSVLTDERYFQGRDEFIRQIQQECSLPILRKDFMLDPYQIVESRYLGADCILIIMSAVDDTLAKEMMDETRNQGMDAILEVHDIQELERAIRLKPDIVGINSRNLKTQTTEFDIFEKLIADIPEECVKIAESGIKTGEDIQKLLKIGYEAFLIGETFMRHKNPGVALQNIRDLKQNENRTKVEHR